jgi:hypothetical protein
MNKFKKEILLHHQYKAKSKDTFKLHSFTEEMITGKMLLGFKINSIKNILEIG